ncbi:phage tail protein [Pseudomonas sp. xss_2]|uniref:phage tail protein n=1 Tax=Pseudomonas sp. xss_2 TaxID=3367215 RepID=UPI00370C872D
MTEILFCPATMGFYIGGRYGAALEHPCVEVSAEMYRQLAGQVLAVGEDGLPVLASTLPLSADQLAENERAWRDTALAIPCAMRDRHRDEVELGLKTTIDPASYAELLSYIQQLREWPQSEHFPSIEHRPIAPLWIAEQAQ